MQVGRNHSDLTTSDGTASITVVSPAPTCRGVRITRPALTDDCTSGLRCKTGGPYIGVEIFSPQT